MNSSKIPDDALFITVEQMAAALQTTQHTIYQKIKAGIIPVTKMMDKPRIPRDFLDSQVEWVKGTETFIERKLQQRITEQNEEIAKLKSTIRSMLRIGMEADL